MAHIKNEYQQSIAFCTSVRIDLYIFAMTRFLDDEMSTKYD